MVTARAPARGGGANGSNTPKSARGRTNSNQKLLYSSRLSIHNAAQPMSDEPLILLFLSVPDHMSNEQRLLDFLNAAFGHAPPADIGDRITEKATFCGPITGGKPIPMLEWAEFSHVIRGLVGPSTFNPLNSISQDDWISLRIEIQSECLASGKRITGYDCLLVRFEGERIAEYIGHMDYLSFFEQLDLVPTGALHACLSGQRLTWQ